MIDIDAADATFAKAAAPAAYDRLREIVLPARAQRAAEEAEANRAVLAQNPKARVNWHHRNFHARWWQHAYRREEFLAAIAPLDRFITTAATASEGRKPVFLFVSSDVHPSHAVQCFALDDEYSLGVLQSAHHEAWFRRRCSTLKADLRYTSKTVFSTFPWPQNPSAKAVNAVVQAAAEILDVREARLRLGLSLAEQYNSLNDGGKNALADAHAQLDHAVVDAYGC